MSVQSKLLKIVGAGATRHKRFTGKLICTAVWDAHVHAGTSETADNHSQSRTLLLLHKQPRFQLVYRF